MPSPFLGMDSFLQSQGDWSSFHTAFIVDIQRELLNVLPDDFDARTKAHVSIVYPAKRKSGESRTAFREPDVAVFATARKSRDFWWRRNKILPSCWRKTRRNNSHRFRPENFGLPIIMIIHGFKHSLECPSGTFRNVNEAIQCYERFWHPLASAEQCLAIQLYYAIVDA